MTVDLLHTLNLGPLQEFGKHYLLEVILSDMYGVSSGRTQK